MNKGRIIFLNGLTSCGKSSVAEQMKTLCGDVLYVVSNDIFHCMVDWKFFTDDYWKMVAHTITAQYYAARGMAEAGFSVVIARVWYSLTFIFSPLWVYSGKI